MRGSGYKTVAATVLKIAPGSPGRADVVLAHKRHILRTRLHRHASAELVLFHDVTYKIVKLGNLQPRTDVANGMVVASSPSPNPIGPDGIARTSLADGRIDPPPPPRTERHAAAPATGPSTVERAIHDATCLRRGRECSSTETGAGKQATRGLSTFNRRWAIRENPHALGKNRMSIGTSGSEMTGNHPLAFIRNAGRASDASSVRCPRSPYGRA